MYRILVRGAQVHRLFQLQKKAIRILTNIVYNATTNLFFKSLGFLKLISETTPNNIIINKIFTQSQWIYIAKYQVICLIENCYVCGRL